MQNDRTAPIMCLLQARECISNCCKRILPIPVLSAIISYFNGENWNDLIIGTLGNRKHQACTSIRSVGLDELKHRLIRRITKTRVPLEDHQVFGECKESSGTMR